MTSCLVQIMNPYKRLSNSCPFNVKLTTNENGEWRSYWIKAGTPSHQVCALLHFVQVLSPQFWRFHGTQGPAHTAHNPGPLQAIYQAAAWSAVVSRNGNWPRAQSCLGLNNLLIGSRDYVICLAFTGINPKKFRRFLILTNHRARKNDCRIALNTPIFREKISLLTHVNKIATT